MEKFRQSRHSGFTVIEVLATVVIIGALAVVAIPAYQSYMAKSRTAEAMTFLSSAQIAEKSFFQDTSSYTLCLKSIMAVNSSLIRYYAVGFNLDASANYDTCGPGGTTDCHQKCFSSSKCGAPSMLCTNDSNDNGIAFASNAFQGGQNVDFYSNPTPSGLGSYPSSISSGDFEIVAATNQNLLAQNDFLKKTYPNAFADGVTQNWKVYAIGPTGGPYEMAPGLPQQASCRYTPSGSTVLKCIPVPVGTDCAQLTGYNSISAPWAYSTLSCF